MKREEEESVSPPEEMSPEYANGKKFTIKYKRPRSSRACVTCHDRKVRCDAQNRFPCTNCISFQCECVLPSTRRIRRTKKEILQDKMRESSESPLGRPNLKEDLRKVLSTVDLRKTSSNFKQLIQGTDAEFLFLGSAAVLHLSKHYKKSIKEVKDQSLSEVDMKILELKGCFHLPSPEICLELIDVYFDHVHPFTPIIDRTHFVKNYAKDLNNPECLMLLNAVLLAASRYTTNPLLLDENGTPDMVSQMFYQRVKTFYELRVRCKPVALVQTLVILGLYWEGTDDVTQNIFYWSRAAITLLQGFGFHKMNDSSSELETKLLKRVWWIIFCRDRYVALSFGRCIVIDLEDCDIPMITPLDFEEEWDGPGENPYQLKPIEVEFNIHSVKICEIIGIVLKQKYTASLDKDEDSDHLAFIKKCDLLMVNWLHNLPPELQYSITDPSTQNIYSGMIMCKYYVLLSVIHRTNILRRRSSHSEYYYPSWGITFQSSHMIALICKNLMQTDELKYCPAFIVTIVFSAIILLFYHIDNKNPKVSSTLKKLLDICTKLLLVVSKYHVVGYICLQMAETLRNNKTKRDIVIQCSITNMRQKLKDRIERDYQSSSRELRKSVTEKSEQEFEPSQLFLNKIVSQSLPPVDINTVDSASTPMTPQLQTSQEAANTLRSIGSQQLPVSNMRNSPHNYPTNSNETMVTNPGSASGSEFSNFDLFDLPHNFEAFDNNVNANFNTVSAPNYNGDADGFHANNILPSPSDPISIASDVDLINQQGAPPNSLNINDWFNFLQY